MSNYYLDVPVITDNCVQIIGKFKDTASGYANFKIKENYSPYIADVGVTSAEQTKEFQDYIFKLFKERPIVFTAIITPDDTLEKVSKYEILDIETREGGYLMTIINRPLNTTTIYFDVHAEYDEDNNPLYNSLYASIRVSSGGEGGGGAS